MWWGRRSVLVVTGVVTFVRVWWCDVAGMAVMLAVVVVWC